MSKTVVAKLRLPIPVAGLQALSDALQGSYGQGLHMVIDSEGWLCILQEET